MARRCIFCGQSNSGLQALSREHVFARALVTRLKKDVGLLQMARFRVRELRFVEERRVPASDFTLRSVCRACNNGWMSDLDATATHLLTHPDVSRGTLCLNADEASILAAWAMKTALVLGFATRFAHLFNDDDARELYATRRPPGYVYVDATTFGDDPTIRWSQTTTGWFFGVDTETIRDLPRLPAWIILDVGRTRLRVLRYDPRTFEVHDRIPGNALRLWPQPTAGVMSHIPVAYTLEEYSIGLVLRYRA